MRGGLGGPIGQTVLEASPLQSVYSPGWVGVIGSCFLFVVVVVVVVAAAAAAAVTEAPIKCSPAEETIFSIDRAGFPRKFRKKHTHTKLEGRR